MRFADGSYAAKCWMSRIARELTIADSQECGAHSQDRSLFSICVRQEIFSRVKSSNSLGKSAPGRTRTCDPRLRRPVLYPTELRARAMDDADLERGATEGSDEDVRVADGLPPF
jgi:hypothetical protein